MKNHLIKTNPYIKAYTRKELINMLKSIKQGYKTTFSQIEIITQLNK